MSEKWPARIAIVLLLGCGGVDVQGPIAVRQDDAALGTGAENARQADAAIGVGAEDRGRTDAEATDGAPDAHGIDVSAAVDVSQTGIDIAGGPEADTDGSLGPSLCPQAATPISVTVEFPADRIVVGTAYGSSSDDVWVTTLPDHEVARWNGVTWTHVDELAGVSILAIAGSGPSDVWLGGIGGVFWHWDGKALAPATGNTTFDITKISILASGQGFALAVTAGAFDLLRLEGTDWSLAGSRLGEPPFDLYAPTPSDAWLASPGWYGRGQVLHYQDGAFVSLGVFDVAGLGGTSSDNVWFGSEMWNGKALVRAFELSVGEVPIWGTGPTDMWIGGVHWDGQAIQDYTYKGVDRDVIALRGLSATDVWATSPYGRITHFDGSTWQELVPAGSDPESNLRGLSQGIWQVGAGALWIAGAFNQIYLYSGGSLIPLPNTGASPAEDLLGVGGSSTTDLWAVGANGAVLHGDGVGWVRSASPTSTTLHSVSASSANDAWAVGDAGTVLHWNGTSWSADTSNTTSNLYSVWATPGYVVAVGANGTIIANEGKGFVPASVTAATLTGVWGRDRSHIYAVGGGILFTYDGRAWSPGDTASDTCVRGVWGTSDGVFANGYYYDGTQARRVVPVYPPGYIRSIIVCMELYGVWASSATELWGVGGLQPGMGPIADAPIYHFNGDCIETVGPSPQPSLYATASRSMHAIFGLGEHDLWAVGDLGMIVHIRR